MANSTNFMLSKMPKATTASAKPETLEKDTPSSSKETSMQKLVQECLIKKDQYSNTPNS
ncbi:hypothetical protein [Legionella hackeliae]|uniref:Uncharacterized protein n=1 Tax=Legionella hackeliae TaxID=449 RepID=A0A0A8URB6_LEGHA|nr:hypothetical protein [Legionella hackeliae]KTD15221.1 hypothetical protein Lhac_0063 [Legionella hackeliae]CEK11415.1 protein of unknown function [Legionella hackeliae]STX48186.1 Uncharacterised protein [Legionella hackeliae]